MSEIKKSQRKESKLQTIHNAYMIRNAVTKLAENNFYFDISKINNIVEQNTRNIQDEQQKKIVTKKIYQYFNNQITRITNRVLDCACGISQHLRIANLHKILVLHILQKLIII